MSRWIDAEWLKELYKPYEDFNGKMYPVPIGAILANIDDAPSIDIVRCKECEHWKGDGVFTLNALGEEEYLCKWWSKFGTIRTAETAFCSYGERRE